jgi:hypothetical protein
MEKRKGTKRQTMEEKLENTDGGNQTVNRRRHQRG